MITSPNCQKIHDFWCHQSWMFSDASNTTKICLCPWIACSKWIASSQAQDTVAMATNCRCTIQQTSHIRIMLVLTAEILEFNWKLEVTSPFCEANLYLNAPSLMQIFRSHWISCSVIRWLHTHDEILDSYLKLIFPSMAWWK